MSMFRIFSVIFVGLLSVSAVSATTVGNERGNGGGVICINGVCKTLIEAGLRLSPEFQGVWIPSTLHYDLVNQTISNQVLLFDNMQQSVYYSVFGRGDHFRKVDVIEPGKLEAIRKQYLEIAAKAGFPIDQSTFQIVAFSSDETVKPALTYLLPKFFELTAKQQAEILIHEGLYRGRPTGNLKYVLQFESAISTAGRGPRIFCTFSSNRDVKTCVDQQILAYRLGFLSRPQLMGALLSVMNNDTKFFAEDVGSVSIKGVDATLTIDPRKILDYGRVDSRLPYIFSQLTRLNFQQQKSEEFDKPESRQLNISWGDKEPKLIYIGDCSPNKPYDFQMCKVYSLRDDSDLKLVLPE